MDVWSFFGTWQGLYKHLLKETSTLLVMIAGRSTGAWGQGAVKPVGVLTRLWGSYNTNETPGDPSHWLLQKMHLWWWNPTLAQTTWEQTVHVSKRHLDTSLLLLWFSCRPCSSSYSWSSCWREERQLREVVLREELHQVFLPEWNYPRQWTFSVVPTSL